MKKNMALGNRIGKIYLWDLDVDDYREIKPSILQHPACTTAVRQTSFSPDSKTLIACCDDGTVWRWDLIQSAKADP
ncbi:EED [Bugula neritina]|uniref:EED n=1 Tax=Bugula neritina TaxID=10212 RepID=A0A7J7KBW9_BUGNE|nr:EED [Bugula neritina]